MSNQQQIFEIGGHRYYLSQAIAPMTITEEVPDHIRATASEASSIYQLDSTNQDLVWMKFTLDAEGANLNWDYMPRPAMVRGHATAKFKPLNMEHVKKEDSSMVGMSKQSPPVRNTIFGVMTGAEITTASGDMLSADDLADLDNTDNPNRSDDEKLTVTAWAAMWHFLFPKTVEDVVNLASEGKMHVSMERWISNCDFMVHDADGKPYAISAAQASESTVFKRWAARQTINGLPIYRRSLAFIYGGVAATKNPAQKLSTFVPFENTSTEASNEFEDILTILQQRNDALLRKMSVSLTDDLQMAVADRNRLSYAAAVLSGQDETSE